MAEELKRIEEAVIQKVLSRAGKRRYLNGDPLELNPSDLRDIVRLTLEESRATPPSPSTAEDERAAFEAWARRTHRRPGTSFDRAYDGTYKDNRIAAKWASWNARAALSANAADREAKDIADLHEIWDCAKAEAAMYVEAHCVDGEMHANHIMAQARPKIMPRSALETDKEKK